MEVDKILEELSTIKDEIAQAKTEKAESEGALKEQMKLLKSFGVTTVAGGKKKLKTIEGQIKKLDVKIQKEYESLKENYEW
jgi:hypothetical protein